MLRRTLSVLALFGVTLLATAGVFATARQEVVVHEWGTFTTVAGEDGQAINWLPLGGPTDLPCFVDRYKNPLFKISPNTNSSTEQEGPVDYAAARSALLGTTRMETPVLYFYSPDDAFVSVNVRFPRGLMTEWYPTAVVAQPVVLPTTLNNPNVVGSITWPQVQINPSRVALLPRGESASHYYAARETDAALLLVNGQSEKFLFYRGIASFPSLISAELNADRSVRVKNLDERPLPGVILFENRAGRITYRLGGQLASSLTLAPSSQTATLSQLHGDLVKLLVSAGLFPKEAEAMVNTWNDSWFEEGTRVFYIVPSQSVDRILPLTVTPSPAAVARAFVGRMEIITPDALVSVKAALAKGDDAALERQGRFLGPITDRLIARTESVSDRNRIRAVTNTVFASYVKRFGGCSQ